MLSWIRRLRRRASQDFVVEGSEWRQLGILAVGGLPIPVYVLLRGGFDVLGLALVLPYIASLVFIVRKKWDWVVWTFAIGAVLAFGVIASWVFWEVLHSEQDSVSTTIRNLGLLIGGAIAIVLAAWRSKVAEGQADTAQQSLLNERYQKGAEMLGSEVLAVRLGGIYALQQLAAEEPLRYHVNVMRLFCAFVVHASKDTDAITHQSATENVADHGVVWAGPDSNLPIRADIQAAMDAICRRRKDAAIMGETCRP